MDKFRFINIGIALSTEVSNLVMGLRKLSSDISFEYASEIIEPDISKKLKDGSYDGEYLHELVEEFMHKNKFKEIPIGITEYPIYDELFSSVESRSAIFSLFNWNKYSKFSINKGLKYMFADALLTFHIEFDPHYETKGCPNDFCDNLTDLNIGMERGEYCEECKQLINNAVEQSKISLSVVALIYRLLDVVADRPFCFVMIPFDPSFDSQYEIIKKVATKNGFFCSRDSDTTGHSIIMNTIIEMIMRSTIVIADLTGKNANVFYELGFAHALEKEAILITQKDEDLPFDIKHRKYYLYKSNDELTHILDKRLGSLKKVKI